MTLIEKLRNFRKVIPDIQALVSINESICYRDLSDIVAAGAATLYQHGIKPNDCVGLIVADELEHILASLSLLALGTRQITLPSHDSSDKHRDLILRSQVRFIVTDQLDVNNNLNLDLNYISWSRTNFLPINRSLRFTEGMLLISTSGTTSNSNIVPFTETQISDQAERHFDYSHERLLRLSSVEFNASKRHRLYSLWNGGTNVFRPNGGLQEIISHAISQEVTCIDVSRMHVSEICSIPNIKMLSGIKVRTGGTEVPMVLRNEFSSMVPGSLYVRYASTETGAISMAGPNDHNIEGSCGKPLPGVKVEIVNDFGETLPSNSIGEIRVQAKGMATNYLDNQEQTTRRFRDGWFYPGDNGCIQTDGNLIVYGRKDDMIILNGINIFPFEIEHVLEMHPDVDYAIALALPSTIHGQIPVAAVQLKPGSKVGLEELMNYSREKLALKCPRRILITEALPRNGQGKLLRREAQSFFMQKKI